MKDEKEFVKDQATIYKNNRQELVSHQKILAQYQETKNKIAIQIQGEIANETDELGNAKFSNETKRKAEFEKRIKDNQRYNQYADMVRAELEEIEEIKAAIDITTMNVRVWDIVTRM